MAIYRLENSRDDPVSGQGKRPRFAHGLVDPHAPRRVRNATQKRKSVRPAFARCEISI